MEDTAGKVIGAVAPLYDSARSFLEFLLCCKACQLPPLPHDVRRYIYSHLLGAPIVFVVGKKSDEKVRRGKKVDMIMQVPADSQVCRFKVLSVKARIFSARKNLSIKLKLLPLDDEFVPWLNAVTDRLIRNVPAARLAASPFRSPLFSLDNGQKVLCYRQFQKWDHNTTFYSKGQSVSLSLQSYEELDGISSCGGGRDERELFVGREAWVILRIRGIQFFGLHNSCGLAMQILNRHKTRFFICFH